MEEHGVQTMNDLILQMMVEIGGIATVVLRNIARTAPTTGKNIAQATIRVGALCLQLLVRLKLETSESYWPEILKYVEQSERSSRKSKA
jgi:hypothetical protein